MTLRPTAACSVAMSKIAILSVSAGAGHTRAAEALRLAAAARGHEAVHLDVMTLVPRLFRKLYADTYLAIVERHPAFWGYLYHASDRAAPDSRTTRMRQAIEGLNTRAFRKTITELAPDYVICTHFLPAQILSRMTARGTFDRPVWVSVTDFDVHQLWTHPHLTGYCVAAEEIAWRIRERAIGEAQVAVTGIPIMSAFAKRLDRTTCARELGLDSTRTTLLLMSGGFGVGAIDLLAARILAVPGNHQLIALAGKNQELLARLTTLAAKHPGRLLPLGFTTTIERVMACADLAITKPGGLTTSECLAVGLPLVVVSPIPGQEERNADYLLERGAALKAHDVAGLEYRIRRILDEPELLRRMQAAIAPLGKADAADRILDRVLG
jgi:processive 1,2-diacylglycerol beta-glucosyltransferase